MTYCSTNAGAWASDWTYNSPKCQPLAFSPLPCWTHSNLSLIIKGYYRDSHTWKTAFSHPACPLMMRGIITRSRVGVCQSNLLHRIMALELVAMESGWLSKYSHPLPNESEKNSITACQPSKRLHRKCVIRLSKCRNTDARDVSVCMCGCVCVCLFEEVGR